MYMNDAVMKKWDLRVKVIGLVTLIASGGWTLYKFREDRRVDLDHEQQATLREEATKKKELNAFIFQRQAMLYFDAANAAAIIATSKDAAEVSKARDRFTALYYGELVVVEDRRVELAMITFERCLETRQDDCSRFPFTQKDKRITDEHMRQLGPGELKNLSLELAACVRTALATDRGIDFGSLSDPKTSCPYD
jgi:hypothetical protein